MSKTGCGFDLYLTHITTVWLYIIQGSTRHGLLTIHGEELKVTVSQPFLPTDFPSSLSSVHRKVVVFFSL